MLLLGRVIGDGELFDSGTFGLKGCAELDELRMSSSCSTDYTTYLLTLLL